MHREEETDRSVEVVAGGVGEVVAKALTELAKVASKKKRAIV
jgi:hypothetical protein